MDDKQKKNLRVDERLRLIDVSSEDDSLIFDVCGFPGSQNGSEYLELSEALNAQEKEDEVTFASEMDQQSVLSESLEPERTRKASKCNLRKSLTWDSAFFTNDGVLDPEELSMINCGLKKAEIHPLPSIQEDLRRSAESNSTLDSDNLSLESLEVDLFADIRASIQRSTKGTSFPCSSIKTRPEEPVIQSLHAVRKMDHASRNKSQVKPVVGSKRQSINAESQEKTKRALNRVRPVQATGKSGEPSSSSLRPPKIIGRVNPVSAASVKRTSLGLNSVKNEPNTARAATGKVGPNTLSKKAGLDLQVSSRSTTPSPNSSSSSLSNTKIESAASCSSHDRSGSTSSGSTCKFPLKSYRNKTSSRNVSPALGSTMKTPPKVLPKNKTGSEDSRLATYLKSVSKLTLSMSPASSIDGWSSESSSSTSTVNQRLNSSKTCLESPRKGFHLERDVAEICDFETYQLDQVCVGHERAISPCLATNKTPEAAILSHIAAADAHRSSKPSGLRMPSPKIGFFDAEKSAVHTPKSPKSGLQLHPGLRSGIPKHGVGSSSLHGGVVKAKPGKHLPSRTVISCDPYLTGGPHSASGTKPTTLAQLREVSNASPKVLSTPGSREKSPGITSKLQNDTSLRTGKGVRLKGGERELTKTDKGSLNAGQNSLKNDMITESKEVHLKSLKRTPTKQDSLRNSHKASSGCDNNIYSSKELAKNLANGENHFDDDSVRSLHKSYEIESSLHVENQVDGLVRNMGSVDNKEGITGQHNLSPSQFVFDSTELALLDSLNAPVLGQDDFGKGLSKSSLLSPRTSKGSYLNTGDRDVTRGNLGFLPNESDNGGQDAFKNDIYLESPNLIHMKSLKSTPTRDTLHNFQKASLGCDYDNMNPLKNRNGEIHREGNLNLLYESNEKENSLCLENQVDYLSRHMGSVYLNEERFTWKNDSSLSPFCVDITDNPGDPKSALCQSAKALVNGLEDFSKDISKHKSISMSSNNTDMAVTRTPLAAKLSSWHGNEPFESALEPARENISTFSFEDGTQADDN